MFSGHERDVQCDIHVPRPPERNLCSMARNAPRPLLNSLASFAGLSIGILGVGFVIRTVVTKWTDVRAAFSGLQAFPLVLSVVLALLGLGLIGFTWSRVLAARGAVVSPVVALSWYFTGQLGKYVPGGIWAIVGRAEMAVRGGIARTDAYVSTGISMTTTYLASIVVICVGSILSWTQPWVGIAGTFAIAIGYGIYTHQRFADIIARLGRRLSRSGLTLVPGPDLARFTAMQVPSWIAMSLSTSVTASAFGADISITEMFFLTATSWLIGFVAIGVPGGIGVRESVFTALATPMVGAPVAVSIALASRVVFIVADVTGTVLGNIAVRFVSAGDRPEPVR